MGTRRFGDDYKIYVRNSAGNAYNPIAGEQGHDDSRNTNFIDFSVKGDGVYGAQKAGKSTVTITVTGIPDLPDPNGLERMHALSKARADEYYQIRLTPFTASDVVFQCLMSTSAGSRSRQQDAPETFNFTLTAVQAPDVDELTPPA